MVVSTVVDMLVAVLVLQAIVSVQVTTVVLNEADDDAGCTLGIWIYGGGKVQSSLLTGGNMHKYHHLKVSMGNTSWSSLVQVGSLAIFSPSSSSSPGLHQLRSSCLCKWIFLLVFSLHSLAPRLAQQPATSAPEDFPAFWGFSFKRFVPFFAVNVKLFITVASPALKSPRHRDPSIPSGSSGQGRRTASPTARRPSRTRRIQSRALCR